MQADLEELKFLGKELEALSGVAINDVQTCDLYRFSALSNRRTLFAFLLNELLILGLTLIVSLPISLMVTRHTNTITNTQTVTQFLLLTVSLSAILAIAWNLYMGLKAKPLVALSKLLKEVEKYNEVIQAVDIIDKLTAAGNLPGSSLNREDAIAALQVTRESLVTAFRTERILRENQQFIGRRYELFNNIENNLSALMALDISDRATEYGRLLNEALEIGMSVHKEVRKLQDRQ